VIELLGIGLAGQGGQWLLHRVCARLEPGALTTVVARTPAERGAFLDAVAGRCIPREGRVWIGPMPLMRETAGRIRARVADVGADMRFAASRSILWNTLVTPGRPLTGLLRLPRRAEREAALRALDGVGLGIAARQSMSTLGAAPRLLVGVARAVASRAKAIVLRDVDTALGADDAGAVLALARGVGHLHRIVVVASLASPQLARAHGDRMIVLGEGAIVFDSCAPEFTDAGSLPRQSRGGAHVSQT
jgi:ABC-type phosphate/phosphonate transport system ATPase subunit